MGLNEKKWPVFGPFPPQMGLNEINENRSISSTNEVKWKEMVYFKSISSTNDAG